MKKSDLFIKEYVVRLSDEDLKFIQNRLYYRFSGDLADILDFCHKHPAMDKYLSGTETSEEIYEAFDSMNDFSDKECIKRFGANFLYN